MNLDATRCPNGISMAYTLAIILAAKAGFISLNPGLTLEGLYKAVMEFSYYTCLCKRTDMQQGAMKNFEWPRFWITAENPDFNGMTTFFEEMLDFFLKLEIVTLEEETKEEGVKKMVTVRSERRVPASSSICDLLCAEC